MITVDDECYNNYYPYYQFSRNFWSLIKCLCFNIATVVFIICHYIMSLMNDVIRRFDYEKLYRVIIILKRTTF